MRYLLAFLILFFPSSALASPQDYQRFDANLIGKGKSVGFHLYPHLELSDAGGPQNVGSKNSGALSTSPFATLVAHISFPKEIKFDTHGFPRCSEEIILHSPDSCPKGSEIGFGSAKGYARAANAKDGTYILSPKLTLRVFIMQGKENLALRVYSALTSAVLIPGRSVSKTQVDITNPYGLISPTPGMLSQISFFHVIISAAKNKAGMPLTTLSKCPKNKKLLFTYGVDYNIGLDKSHFPKAENGFSINQFGKPVKSLAKCS